jgi:hypothetical protein
VINSIDVTTLVGLRDRALIGIMVHSFARVSAVVSMRPWSLAGGATIDKICYQ